MQNDPRFDSDIPQPDTHLCHQQSGMSINRVDFTDRSTIIRVMNTSVDTKQRIIDSAQELIYARSYTDVGVQEICNRAGVKKGSFYHFFPSKRDLTLAVLDQLEQFFRDSVQDNAFSSDRSPLERIDRLIELIYEFQRHTREDSGQILGCPFGNLAGEMSTQDEQIRQRVMHIFRGIEARIAESQEDAIATGELADINVQASAEAIFAYIEGIVLIAKARNDPEVIRKLGKAVRGLMVPATMVKE